MKLYRYENIEDLNKALAEFSTQGTPIAKVKLLTESDNAPYNTGQISLRTVFFVLTDETGNYQPKGEVPPDDENPDERRSSEKDVS